MIRCTICGNWFEFPKYKGRGFGLLDLYLGLKPHCPFCDAEIHEAPQRP